MRIVLTTHFSPFSAYSGGGQRSTHNLAVALAGKGHRVTAVYTRGFREEIDAPADLAYDIRWATLPSPRSSRRALLRPLAARSVARVVQRLLEEEKDRIPQQSQNRQGGQSNQEARHKRRADLTARHLSESIGQEDGEPVVVHANGEEGAHLPALLAQYPFRLVITPRFPDYPDRLVPDAGVLDRLRLYLTEYKFLQLGRVIRGAHRCCPTSQSAAGMVRRVYGLAAHDITVIPNGVSPEFLAAGGAGTSSPSDPKSSPAPPSPVVPYSLARLPSASPLIVFFGRFSHGKGADTVIRALALLDVPAPHSTRPTPQGAEPAVGPSDARPTCILIGRGEEEQALRRLAAHLGVAESVQFRDWMEPEALACLLSTATLAVLPSREESFGNAIAEAMATGCPVISTTAGSIPEIVNNEENGVLVPPDDPPRLAEAIGQMINDPEKATRLGKAGRESVLNRFTWSIVADRYLSLYRSL